MVSWHACWKFTVHNCTHMHVHIQMHISVCHCQWKKKRKERCLFPLKWRRIMIFKIRRRVGEWLQSEICAVLPLFPQVGGGGSVSDCIQKFAAHQLQSNLLGGGGTSVRIIKVRAWDSKLWVHTLVAQMGLGGTYGHLWVTQRSCTEILVIVRIMSASCFCCMEYNE